MSHSPIQQIIIGFKAPLHSVSFFKSNKGMLILGVIPHIFNLLFYIWLIRNIIIAKWIRPLFNSLSTNWHDSFIAPIFNPTLIESVVWIVGILFYGIFGTAFVNAFASPLYDIIAQKAYEKTSGTPIRQQSFMDFIDSIISEVTKGIIIISIVIISFFVQIFAPLVFFVGIWYLGWSSIDRTLLLMNLPLRKRFIFGIRNWGLCFGLGIWNYIPLIGAIFSFAMAAAGAIIVAESKAGEAYVEDQNDLNL
ncbi:EI24 domain-containing protein [Fluviispira multicolorata]|uniref:CysZ protein n=1 Tax=Fluviispira multicolorata TaxID=2654512 RepID=A0A833N3W0_9BACT|nr:EI24 domain-containing protein [Fluviispira multicolorata]KAB8030769.1 hypothetical protein GCL57_07290 [Fluviispira multicolorata]